MKSLINESVNKDVRHDKCIYCKKPIKTCSDVPKCSRKDCKKQYNRISHDGTQQYISYDDKMIQQRVLQ